MPEEYRYLFVWARDLIRENRLTYTEVKAWADLTGETLFGWEVQALMRIDLIYHRVRNERRQS